MNIYNYIENTKNNNFDNLTTLDALIFTRLSYIHFEKILDKLPISILNLSSYLIDIHTSKKDIKLINLLQKSKRFKDIRIKCCGHIQDITQEEQMTAITIILPNDELFISFRGTTKNVYDFKEDMNMSYKIIPSCIDAVKYVNEEAKSSKVYISGHSKGGHLAMYAGINAKWYIKRKIKKIYNFDGPGFLTIDKKFNLMKKKIINYFPENSVVGRLMNNEAEIIAIKTNKQGIESHNIYNWKVVNDDLVIGKLTNKSNEFHQQCLTLLDTISKEKREEVIKYFFTIMMKGEIKSIKELDLSKIKRIIDEVPHLLKNEKKELINFAMSLIKCTIPTASSSHKVVN